MDIVTIDKNKAYQIIFVAEPSNYDTYFPIVLKMLESIPVYKRRRGRNTSYRSSSNVATDHFYAIATSRRSRLQPRPDHGA